MDFIWMCEYLQSYVESKWSDMEFMAAHKKALQDKIQVELRDNFIENALWNIFFFAEFILIFSACDSNQAWWADGGGRDGGGSAELPQDEHLPWQRRPLVLAKAQVCCRLN